MATISNGCGTIFAKRSEWMIVIGILLRLLFFSRNCTATSFMSVDVTIEEIDDGDDLDEESSDFDLRTERHKSVTLKFQLPLEVEEDDFNAEEEYKKVINPNTKLGDVYQLGNHRIICGDATDLEVYEKLMGDEKAQLIYHHGCTGHILFQ